MMQYAKLCIDEHHCAAALAHSYLGICFILEPAAAVIVYLCPGVAHAGGHSTQPTEGLQKDKHRLADTSMGNNKHSFTIGGHHCKASG